jgi:uncharacterized protein (DUF58 family)
MIEPTERALWLLAAIVVLGGVGIVAPALGAAAPYALGGLGLLFVVDAVLARSPRAVTITREFPERLVEGKVETISLHVTARERIEVEVTDTLPGAVEPWLTGRAMVGEGVDVTLRAQRRFRRRGTFTAGRIAIRTHGPLGLVRRRERRFVPETFRVSIDLPSIARRAVRLVRGTSVDGIRRRRAFERGRELDSLRDYRRGDDIRFVDWKATARSGGLVVKELVPETRQDVVVVLDAGRQFCGHEEVDNEGADAPKYTGTPSHTEVSLAADLPRRDEHASERPKYDGTVGRFVRAEEVALVLAASALHKGDRAGLLVLADDVLGFVAPGEGRGQLKAIADATAVVEAAAVEPAYASLSAFLAPRLKRRSLLCVVTDVVDDATARALAQGLASLRGRHVVVVVALADPALHRLAHRPPEPEDPLGDAVPAAAARLLSHRRKALAALEAVGVTVIDTPSARAAGAAVDAYLAVKAQGRL